MLLVINRFIKMQVQMEMQMQDNSGWCALLLQLRSCSLYYFNVSCIR